MAALPAGENDALCGPGHHSLHEGGPGATTLQSLCKQNTGAESTLCSRLSQAGARLPILRDSEMSHLC